MELCTTIEKAINGQQGHGLKPRINPELPKDIIFIAAKGCYDETIMQEHLVEVTVMGQQGNIILSTIVAPRVFVTINPQHLGFEEDELTQGKDEIATMIEIRKLVRNKIIITYNIRKVMRLCGIFTGTIHGFIDLERQESLRRQCGKFTNQIKFIQMTKKMNIKTRNPIRTTQRCHIYNQLWKKVEQEAIEIIQMNYNYTEEDVIELQNRMEDEFTSIGKTPQHLPRKLITETPIIITKKRQQEIMEKLTNAFTIDTSPIKRLKSIEESQIPLLKTIQNECEVRSSNIPKTCLINGKLHQIQAIIANPIQEPSQTILCQTSQYNSQGREIQKGGRNVRDYTPRTNPEKSDNQNSK